MRKHVLIDGNNLLFAMHEHAPVPHVGRETLVRIVDRWVRKTEHVVTIVFDGPVPAGGLAQQMSSSRVNVRFSAAQTADDVIVGMVHARKEPGAIRVVSGDTAIRREARHHKCGYTDSVSFVDELFNVKSDRSTADDSEVSGEERAEKPAESTPEETQKWLDAFGIEDHAEPFDGYDAMQS